MTVSRNGEAGVRRSGAMPAFRWQRWFLPVFAVVLGLDQITKKWLFSLPIIHPYCSAQHPGPISWSQPMLDRSYNPGVAWGAFGHWPVLVTCVTAVMVPLICLVWWRYYRLVGRCENVAFAAIIGGALGNGIDRFMSQLGHLRGVRDFISVDLHPIGIDYIWPTFNIADAGISVGFAFLLILSCVRTKPRVNDGGVRAMV
jgi:signal peptidase II